MRRTKYIASCTLAAGFLLLWSRDARAASYYVATTGSDSNAGSSASPFLTIQQGVNAAAPGDTIIVENGTYMYSGNSGGNEVTISKAGTSSAWITLEAQNPGQAFLNGNNNLGGYAINFAGGSAYWIIKGFDISYFYNIAIMSNSLAGNNVQILGNIIHNIGNVTNNTTAFGECGIYNDTGASNWTINGNVFHDVGRTANLTGTHDHSVYTHGTNVAVVNNVFYNLLNGWDVQIAAGFSGYIENNTFFGPDPYAGKVGQIMLWDVDVSVRVANNIFYNPTGDAITTYQTSYSAGCSIDHNIVYNNSSSVALIDSLPATCTQSSNLLNVNPMLTTPSVTPYSNANFVLLAGSPAIAAGAMLSPQVVNDFNGVSRPQGAAYDIGAFQYSNPAQAAPTVITAVSALGVSSTSATIVWVTNNPADTQVQFGPTSAYGTTTTLIAAPVASHSVGLAGLTTGTVYHYQVMSRDAGGNLVSSPDAVFTTSAASATPPVISAVTATSVGSTGATIVWTTNEAATSQVAYGTATAYAASSGCVTSSGGVWQNVPMTAQTGSFTASFDATPSAANEDGVSGLSNGAASAFTSLAAAVRFNGTGTIDALNGGAYAASATIPYSAGTSYHFQLVVDLPAGTYSAYVTQGSNAQQLIGLNYAFRSGQNAVLLLDNLGIIDDTAGSVTVCNAAP